jgi:hypothetical protein
MPILVRLLDDLGVFNEVGEGGRGDDEVVPVGFVPGRKRVVEIEMVELTAEHALLDIEWNPIVDIGKEPLGIVGKRADPVSIDVDAVDTQLFDHDMTPGAQLLVCADWAGFCREDDCVLLWMRLVAGGQS